MIGDDVENRPWIVAHRGANRRAPENTRAAFHAALAEKIDGIELDVQLSSDGIPIVYHDRTLHKICKRHQRVADLTRKELSLIDWGSWYHKKFAGEPLTTLADVFTLLAGKTRLLIEIKSDRREKNFRPITRAVLELIEKKLSLSDPEDIFILSFDPRVLALVNEIAPKLRLVRNIESLPQDPVGGESFIDRFPYLYGICLPIARLSREIVSLAHQKTKKIMTYSCNTRKQLEKALAIDVDVIMTDKPDWLVRMILSGD